ncbi:MAG: hypothetical protein MZV70_15035 [Desulfobacterales bacterium]|nr:hypothetical protein [Desulfobacterales bacterium]
MSRESQIIASMRANGKKGGTLASVINADFINTEDTSKPKRFLDESEHFQAEFKGMDTGDVNNDGLNEIVTINKNSVFYIYKKMEDNLALLDKIKGNSFMITTLLWMLRTSTKTA